ncbi:Proliferating cell nuclear antigen [Tetrabaena socialis]|uniref:DNA sliding clamp PCNA n=1 Tax=Tetrabaena socialis TaxID=47790 RepID=A0A2J7ZL00_9CHLO|nr:Proliferating cell nuclear antigen [Tetrabaena socialis]|eukprot:PNH00944.1 Proliferating cell nuclear antigen [Tetrabaena socialis]
MASITFASAKQLRAIAEAIGEFVDEINFDFNSIATALTAQAMDASHICMVSLSLAMSLFSSIQGATSASFSDFSIISDFSGFSGPAPTTLGIHVPSLIRVLKCAGPDDSALLTSSGDTLKLAFMTDGDERSADVELKLMLIDTEKWSCEERLTEATFRMSSSLFARAMKDLSTLGSSVKFEFSSDELALTCDGTIGRARMRFKSQSQSQSQSQNQSVEEAQASFSLKALVSITKACCLAEDVTLHLVQGMPLRVEFDLDSISKLQYHLAPVNDDDDVVHEEEEL